MPGWVIDFCTGSCSGCKLCDYRPSAKKIWSKEELKKARESEQTKYGLNRTFNSTKKNLKDGTIPCNRNSAQMQR